jgi:glutathione S-transferase
MKLELISFKICPFVQRAVITLLHKGMPFDISYINLGSPPDWFKTVSPFGKVPLLKVDDKDVIFESAIIDEFLDEICPGNLLPKDPLPRALDRSWIDFGSTLLLNFSGLIHATSEEAYEAKLVEVRRQLDWLEGVLGAGPYFNQEQFSLVDIAYAPLFMRSEMLGMGQTLYPEQSLPKVSAWSKKLLDITVLKDSVVPEFEELLTSHIREKAPYAAQRLGL